MNFTQVSKRAIAIGAHFAVLLPFLACETKPQRELPQDNTSNPTAHVGVPVANAPPVASCPAPLSEEQLANYTLTGCDRLLESTTIVLVRVVDVRAKVDPVYWVNWPESSGEHPEDAACVATGSLEAPSFSPSVELDIEVIDVLWGTAPAEQVAIPSRAIQNLAWNPSVALDSEGNLRWVENLAKPAGGKLASGLELVLFLDHVVQTNRWLIFREMFERTGDAVVRQLTGTGPAGSCVPTPDQQELETLLSPTTYDGLESAIRSCVEGLTAERAASVAAREAEKQTMFQADPNANLIDAATCWLTPEITSEDSP